MIMSTPRMFFLRMHSRDFGCEQNSRVKGIWRLQRIDQYNFIVEFWAPSLRYNISREKAIYGVDVKFSKYLTLRWLWAEKRSRRLLCKLWIRNGRRNTEQKCKSFTWAQPWARGKRWSRLKVLSIHNFLSNVYTSFLNCVKSSMFQSAANLQLTTI